MADASGVCSGRLNGLAVVRSEIAVMSCKGLFKVVVLDLGTWTWTTEPTLFKSRVMDPFLHGEVRAMNRRRKRRLFLPASKTPVNE